MKKLFTNIKNGFKESSNSSKFWGIVLIFLQILFFVNVPFNWLVLIVYLGLSMTVVGMFEEVFSPPENYEFNYSILVVYTPGFWLIVLVFILFNCVTSFNNFLDKK